MRRLKKEQKAAEGAEGAVEGAAEGAEGAAETPKDDSKE
jgi:hypothetical protein